MNPLIKLLHDHQLPLFDFGVIGHGLPAHGRDYIFEIENDFEPARGTYLLTLTHVVAFDFETTVRDNTWQASWGDELIDYDRWQAEGEPGGYLFGVNWSLADKGFEAIDDDPDAAAWSKRLGRPMHAVSIETSQFKMRLIFHAAHLEQLNGEARTVSRVLTPYRPSGERQT